MKYELFNNDCLIEMKNIAHESVDMILTDPPYNISQKNNLKTMGRFGIDFGAWDKNFDLTEWINVCSPLLKKGGNIVIFCSWKTTTPIISVLEQNNFEIKDMIRWKKTNAMPRNRDRRFIVDYEIAIWAVKKGAKWTFNRMAPTYEIPEIVSGITPKSEKYYGSHPTQKPVYVMEWILERLSNVGDVILDPFMGSGSIGVACNNVGREFIGMEIDATYFNIAKQRIKECEK